MKESSTHLPIYQIPHGSHNAYELGLLKSCLQKIYKVKLQKIYNSQYLGSQAI